MSLGQNVSLVSVPFHNDTIAAIQTDDGPISSVIIKGVCESLGIDYSSQLQKLKTYEWACVGLITIQVGGQRRQVATLDIESLPMWLAGIKSSKVHPAIRPRLLQYQREARAVLAAWFLGVSTDRPELAQEFKEVQARLEERVERLERSLEASSLHTKIWRDEARTSVAEAEDSQRLLVAMIVPDDPDAADAALPYMSFREFGRVFGAKDAKGREVIDLSLMEARTLSREVGDLSRGFGVDIRKLDGTGPSSINLYRIDVLVYWQRSRELNLKTTNAKFEALTRGRKPKCAF